MRNNKPFEQSVVGAERRQGDGAFVGGYLVEGGDQVEQGKNTAFAQGVEDLIDAGVGELFEGADGVQLLIVDGDGEASI